ncbi:hypothetical protein [Actinoplanes sp. GCM10030250]|uniref:hypothetical protein n=1 Tax=Actinoplanes sp. GCM10030250 TaxID=3273376 RepID=UPI00360E75B8
MRSRTANGDARLLAWLRVREFAVPPTMIRTATARRLTGDWAGACAAARVDTDVNPRAVARTHGFEVASHLRADLRRLAPDLLRWHLPRVAPDGLLRPGLTVSLARYDPPGAGPLHLVARTPPAWADAGQRISLALWQRSAPPRRPPPPFAGSGNSRHPDRPFAGPDSGGHRDRPFTGLDGSGRPDRRFRLDLHRHLWDAGRAGELWQRSRPDLWPARSDAAAGDPALSRTGYAVHRWADEARLLREADGLGDGPVVVRLGDGRRLLLDANGCRDFRARSGLPVLPDAATCVPPDLELLRAGLISADALHPLVAAALVPGHRPAEPTGTAASPPAERVVECRGRRHRIGLVDGVLAPLDHDPAELRREEMLAALGGTPMPCLRAVDLTVRQPEALDDVRARLDHGDYEGALGVLERLIGPSAMLRAGALRDELEAAAERRLTHSMFRAGLTGSGPPRLEQHELRRVVRSRPRHALTR